MGSGSDILAAIQGTQEKPIDTGYGLGAAVLGQAAPSLINPYGSVGSNAAYGLGSTLLTAVLAGLAKNDAQTQNAAIAPMLGQMLATDDPTERSQLVKDNPRLSPLYQAIAANDLDSSLAAKAEVKKQNALLPVDLSKQAQLKTLDMEQAQGKAFDPATGQLIQVYDPIKQAADKVRAEEQAKKDVATPDVIGNPAVDPKIQAALAGLPKQYQSEAVKQISEADKLDKSKQVINKAFDNALSIHSLSALNPFSKDNADFSTDKAKIFSELTGVWSQRITEKEMTQLTPLLPEKTDTAAQLAVKKQAFTDLLDRKSPSTFLVPGVTGQSTAPAATIDPGAAMKELMKRGVITGGASLG